MTQEFKTQIDVQFAELAARPYTDERGNLVPRPTGVMGAPTQFDSYWDGRIDED